MVGMVPISKSDIVEKVPDISVKTVELVLRKMLKENKIKKIGTYFRCEVYEKMNINEIAKLADVSRAAVSSRRPSGLRKTR